MAVTVLANLGLDVSAGVAEGEEGNSCLDSSIENCSAVVVFVVDVVGIALTALDFIVTSSVTFGTSLGGLVEVGFASWSVAAA